MWKLSRCIMGYLVFPALDESDFFFLFITFGSINCFYLSEAIQFESRKYLEQFML